MPSSKRTGKSAIRASDRRALAMRHAAEPGVPTPAFCFYCGAEGSILWYLKSNGEPGGWVHFKGLEIDHVIPEHHGGASDHTNYVLACQNCNRRKGTSLEFADRSQIDRRSISDESENVLAPRARSRIGRDRRGSKSSYSGRLPRLLRSQRFHDFRQTTQRSRRGSR